MFPSFTPQRPVAYKCTPFLQPSKCICEEPIFSSEEIFSYLGSEVIVLTNSSDIGVIRGTLMAFDCRSNILLMVRSLKGSEAIPKLLEISGEHIIDVSKT